jgi:hypothetical protein
VADLKRWAKTMKLRWWIEISGKKKLLVFALVILAIAVFCTYLPAEAWRVRRRQLIPFPITMSLAWIAGWFLLFFVRAEDLHILAPFDYQGATRVLGILLIASGAVSAGLLYMTYVAP